MKLVASSRYDLVAIRLVANVPHDLITRRVENIMQGEREFSRAETGAEVATGLADPFEDHRSQLGRHLRELIDRQFLEVLGSVDLVE
jgi:hypothetical protein